MSYFFVYSIKSSVKLTVVTWKKERESEAVRPQLPRGTTSSHECRHQPQDTKSRVCSLEQEENLEHFLLHCAAYQDIRKDSNKLQQPYSEDKHKIMREISSKTRTKRLKEQNLL